MNHLGDLHATNRDSRKLRSWRGAASMFVLAIAVGACGSTATTTSPSVPNQPQPSPTGGQAQQYVVVFRLIDMQSGQATTHVSVTVLDGPQAGVTSTTVSDQLSVQLPAGAVTVSVSADGYQPVQRQINVTGAMVIDTPSQRTPTTLRRLYWGTVRDGRGQPLAGATLIFCGDTLTTNAAGYYEEYTTQNTCHVTVTYPNAPGYIPVDRDVANGQWDFTLRRVVSVVLQGIPATMNVGNRAEVRVLVTLDDGTSTNTHAGNVDVDQPTVLHTIMGSEYIEALSPGTATITAIQNQVASPPVTIQVNAQ